MSIYLRLHICLSSQQTLTFHGIMAQRWTEMLIPVPRFRLSSGSPALWGAASHGTRVTEVLEQEKGSQACVCWGGEESEPCCSPGCGTARAAARQGDLLEPQMRSPGPARSVSLLARGCCCCRRCRQLMSAARFISGSSSPRSCLLSMFKFGMKAVCNSRAVITH